jgi:hypothetical protein
MARISASDRNWSMSFREQHQQSAAFNESNDCAVKAVSLATGTPYAKVHELMAKHGREARKGTYWNTIRRTVEELGFNLEPWSYRYVPFGRSIDPVKDRCLTSLIKTYPGRHGEVLKSITTHHPVRFAEQWKFARGKSFIAEVRGGRHVAAIVNGEVHDWTKGRAMRVIVMWEVLPK